MTEVHGFADEGFGPVADAFRANFDENLETGAAVAVYRNGRLVVDLHAGVADTTSGERWAADTLAVTFSVTKGLMALSAYLAQQEGLLDFDAPVTSLWPEYAAHGKETTTVRDLFSHRAGVVAIDADLDLDDLTRWTPVVTAIEATRPQFTPGTTFAYHALTYGWLTGEVLRRATGRLPGDLLDHYLSAPLAAQAWIGLPEDLHSRVARIVPAPVDTSPQTAELVRKILAMPTFVRSVTLGGLLPLRPIDPEHGLDFNSPALHSAQIPAANGITTARDLARIYSTAVTSTQGIGPLLTEESIADALIPRSSGTSWPGALTPPGIRFSTGFLLDGPARSLLSDTSFGHDGANGGLAFADTGAQVGFAYLNNRMPAMVDERAGRITTALREAVEH
ncbi:serine hydrolase domain-containing protein [Lentzea sp. NPDC034063]|uniref:serine hydrolase domain-containing protein n=1 Tax=unclassified Lentzea TaxID=2643253 RepID=UPI0033F32838